MMLTNLEIEKLNNLPPNDSFLYRYVTIDKLLDFLSNGRIPLVRLNVFEDKLEGVDINHLLLNYYSDKIAEETAKSYGGIFKHITHNVNPTRRNELRREREKFQKINYASCWYVNNHESVAMWQLYSRPDSVAIRIPFNNLSNELENYSFELTYNEYEKFRYGTIDYHRFNDHNELLKIEEKENNIGFIKDTSFKHEQEFRIMVEVKFNSRDIPEKKGVILDEQIERLNEKQDVKVLYLSLQNFKNLPFEIIFHPQSFNWHRENITQIINKFGLKFITSESVLKDIFK